MSISNLFVWFRLPMIQLRFKVHGHLKCGLQTAYAVYRLGLLAKLKHCHSKSKFKKTTTLRCHRDKTTHFGTSVVINTYQLQTIRRHRAITFDNKSNNSNKKLHTTTNQASVHGHKQKSFICFYIHRWSYQSINSVLCTQAPYARFAH